ncbi:MAG TPA: hypothetical protein VFU02_01520 [Polyangiaceae bacterium]|nr:hypothetical protein [Polyangiaceae bacterium]
MKEQVLGWIGKVRSLAPVRFFERRLVPTAHRDALAIAVLVSVFVPTFLEAQRTPGGSDDCVYFEYAAGYPSGAPHHQQRFGLLATVKLAQAVFGYTSLAYYSVPFVYGLGLILASYYAARALMGAALSMLAASMVLALPTLLQQSTWLLADIPSMFWIVLGVALFLRALDARPTKWPLKQILGSGLCFFLAVATKESSAPLLLGLGFFPLALMSKRSLLVLLATAAVTAALELVELAAMWAIFDDVWYRLHAIEVEQLPYMERAVQSRFELPEHITWGSLATRFLSSVANDSSANGWRLLGLGYWDWLVVSLPLGLTVAVLRKDRLLLGLFGFVFWSYLSLSLAVSSLDPLIPMVITKARYFLVVLVWLPILVMAGWACFWASPWQGWQRAKAATAIGVPALYLCVSYGTARDYLERTSATIRSGATPLADFYGAVTAFASTGAKVKRVVGPRQLRAARFTWPEHPFEVVWRPDELATRHRIAVHDFVIAQEPLARQVPPDLLWRNIGGNQTHRYAYIEDWKQPHAGRHYGLVADRSALLRREPRARLVVRLKLDAHRVTPEPLRVVAHRSDREFVVLESLAWQRKGRVYVIDTSTRSFDTSDIQAVSAEFHVQGSGRFWLEKPRLQLTNVGDDSP